MSTNKVENYKQADGLRGILTLFVIARHWIPHGRKIGRLEEVFLSIISLIGEIGMYFFFVLSGFLITGILLKNRILAEAGNYNKVVIWKNYFIRRTLRIFPIYYLSLSVLIYFNVMWIREFSSWHISYMSNVLFYNINHWGIGGHLWSLSCEEQFYLIWPFLILFIPIRYLKNTIIGFIFLAPFFRMLMNYFNPSMFTQLLTPAVFDGLGLGSLLATHRIIPSFTLDSHILKKKINTIGLVGINLILLFYFKPADLNIWNEFNPFYEFFFRSSFAMVGLFIVFGCINGFKGFWPFLLENRIVLFLGKISYSLYLLHNYQLYLFEWFKVSIQTTGWYLIIQFGILLLFSTLSWYLFELPINNLKKYYPYLKK